MKTKKAEVITREVKHTFKGGDGIEYTFVFDKNPYDDPKKQKYKSLTMNKTVIQNIRAMASLHLSRKHIAHILNVDPKAFEKLCNNNPEIQKILDEGKSIGIMKVAERAFSIAESGRNPNITMAWLDRVGVFDVIGKNAKHYQIDVTGKETIEELDDMSFEEKLEKFHEYNKTLETLELRDRSKSIEENKKNVESILEIKKSK